MIKKLAIGMTAISLLSAAAFAGPEDKNPIDKNPVPACPTYYADQEFSIEVFGIGAFRTGTPGQPKDGPSVFDNKAEGGGGGEVQYFFTRNLGVGIEGDGLALRGAAGAVAGNVYLRAPLNQCSPIAPYLMAGIGGLFLSNDQETFAGVHYDENKFEGHVGAGIEYRFTQHIGAFVDGRFVFVTDSNDHIPKFGEVRGGIKYAF